MSIANLVGNVKQGKFFDAVDAGNLIKNALRGLSIYPNGHDGILAGLRPTDSHETDVQVGIGQLLAHSCNEARSVCLKNQ